MAGYGCLCEWDEDGNPVGEHGPLCFTEFRQVAASIPKPTVDSFHVNSKQEVEALREFIDRHEDNLPTYLRWSSTLGIPVYEVEDTPPGVLRAMLNGEVVDEWTAR